MDDDFRDSRDWIERRNTRDRMLDALRKAGRPMAVAELSRATGIGQMKVAYAAGQWRAYFHRVEDPKQLKATRLPRLIGLHPHLAG